MLPDFHLSTNWHYFIWLEMHRGRRHQLKVALRGSDFANWWGLCQCHRWRRSRRKNSTRVTFQADCVGNLNVDLLAQLRTLTLCPCAKCANCCQKQNSRAMCSSLVTLSNSDSLLHESFVRDIHWIQNCPEICLSCYLELVGYWLNSNPETAKLI